MVILAVGALNMPISKNQYSRDDPQNIDSKLEIVRYPLAIKIKTRVAHGACDDIKGTSSMTNGKQIITITTPSESKSCTMQAVYSQTNIKVFAFPWQKVFMIKYYDDVIYDGRL